MYTLLRPHSHAVGQIPIVPISDNYCTIDDILLANNGRRLLPRRGNRYNVVAIIPNQAFQQHNKRAWRAPTWGNRFFYHVYHGYHERRVPIFSGGKGLCLKGTDFAFNVRKNIASPNQI